jgi:hypothetical protein
MFAILFVEIDFKNGGLFITAALLPFDLGRRNPLDLLLVIDHLLHNLVNLVVRGHPVELELVDL